MKKNLFKKLTFGLHKKIFIMIVMSGFLLLLTLTITVSNLLYKFIGDEYNVSIKNQTQQICNSIEANIDKMKMFVMIMAINEDIKKLMDGKYDEYEKFLITKSCYHLMQNIAYTNSGCYIDLYCNHNYHILSTDPYNIKNDYSLLGIDKKEWYRKIQDSATDLVFLGDYSPLCYSGNSRFAVALRYKPFNSFNEEGLIVYSISKQYFTEMLKNTSYIKQDFLLIIDENNKPIYSSNPANHVMLDLGIEKLNKVLQGKKNIYVSPEGKHYKVDFIISHLTGWKIISFYSQERVRNSLFNINILIMLITTLCMGVMIVSSYYIARRFTKPLNNLMQLMKKAETENYKITADTNQNDEIGELSVCFNNMMKTIRENQVLRKEAEIEALQQQINPHFFYNTLESIKALAAIYGAVEIEEITDKMSDIFRYNLARKSTKLVKISEEISHVMNYISIQKIRFNERLNIIVKIDPQLNDYCILKFTLQPIVENAIRHAIEKMQNNGLLSMYGHLNGDKIIIKIADNYGMDPDTLAELRFMLKNNYEKSDKCKGKASIGLNNVNERIKLFYGEQYGLSIDSEKGKGTCVTIVIPANKYSGDFDDNSCNS